MPIAQAKNTPNNSNPICGSIPEATSKIGNPPYLTRAVIMVPTKVPLNTKTIKGYIPSVNRAVIRQRKATSAFLANIKAPTLMELASAMPVLPVKVKAASSTGVKALNILPQATIPTKRLIRKIRTQGLVLGTAFRNT